MNQPDNDFSDPTRERLELSADEQQSVTVQAELSSVLEESVESLSAAVGGWRSELARSSERSSRLEATIASLAAAMETWKSDMARTGARAEERLLRALEILESRMTQHQAISGEIRESLGSSASWLTRAMEEWKAEIRYGSGLTEVRLLSAIENLEGRVGQVQETETQTRALLENSTAQMGRNLEDRLQTVKAVQDETREWLEAAATAMGNDAQSALGRLKELGSSLDAFRGEMRQGAADDQARASDSHTLQVGRIDDVVRLLADAQSATGQVREESNAAITSLKGSLEEWKSALDTSTTKSETRLLRALEALEAGITQTRALGSENQEQIGESLVALSSSLSETKAAAGRSTEMVSELESKFSKALEGLEGQIARLSGSMQEWHDEVGKTAIATETKLVRSLEALESGIIDGASGRQEIENRLLLRLEDLEARLSRTQQEGEERQERLEISITGLAQSIDDWRNKGRESAGKTRERLSQSLEALENRILESREYEADHRDSMRSEIVALTDAVENFGSGGKDHATLMRGLEELDEGLLRNRDDVANLAETFEAQFEIFESRVGDAVAARIGAIANRIDELEHNLQERNKALVTLILGPRADTETFSGLETPTPRRRPPDGAESVVEPRPGQQARRRR
ncbi:MAG: hypothetical protein WD627_10450 [Actinomycetota bacterium]